MVLAACDDGAPTGPPGPAAAPTTAAPHGHHRRPPPPGRSPPPRPASTLATSTLAQTEGPYFTPRLAETHVAAGARHGEVRKLTVTGYVLDADAARSSGALLDFWQADDAGEYDDRGYRCGAPVQRRRRRLAPETCLRGSIRAGPATSTSRSRPPTARS